VREIHPQKEKIGESVARDVEQATPLVNAGIGRARCLVEKTHFTEHLATPENRESLFAHAGHVTTDANLTLEDEKESIPRIAVGKDERPEGVRFFAGDRGNRFERFGSQPREEVNLGKDIDVIA
jgi:hypothetical protein